MLGGNEALTELIETAKEYGMRVILDGVFSHTGSDSVYFNREGRYSQPGAYQGLDSPYYSWYHFQQFPNQYQCWWGFDTLPEVNEENPGWQEFVIKGEDSVMKHWLHMGIGGYRLDVADELPDDVLELMRSELKKEYPDMALIGEVWEDATTKESYGVRRRYALGGALDSVMNYPLRNAIVDFLLNKIDAYGLKDFLISQWQNYPQPMYFSLMNLLSTHDIIRIRTALAANPDTGRMSREQQAGFVLTLEQRERGTGLQKIAAALIYSLPGIPCIYYGDEVGMTGLTDPFNRRSYRVEEEGLREFYQNIGNIRTEQAAYRTGEVAFCALNNDVIAILRWAKDVKQVNLTIVNRANETRTVACDLTAIGRGMVEEVREYVLRKPMCKMVCLLTHKEFACKYGLIEIQIEPLQTLMLSLEDTTIA